MGRDFMHNRSGRGAGQWPFGDGQSSPEEEPLDIVLGRMVPLMLSEALLKQSREIQILLREDGCPVLFLRDGVRFERDVLPRRFFDPLRIHLASMCGMDVAQGEGTCSASLKRTVASPEPYAEVNVAVKLTDAGVTLTITALRETAP